MAEKKSRLQRDVREVILPKDAVRHLFTQNSREKIQLNILKANIERERKSMEMKEKQLREKLIQRFEADNATENNDKNYESKSLPNTSTDSESYIFQAANGRKRSFASSSSSTLSRSSSLLATKTLLNKDDKEESHKNGLSENNKANFHPKKRSQALNECELQENDEQKFNLDLKDKVEKNFSLFDDAKDDTETQGNHRKILFEKMNFQTEPKRKEKFRRLSDLQLTSRTELDKVANCSKLNCKRKISLQFTVGGNESRSDMRQRDVQLQAASVRSRRISLQEPYTVAVKTEEDKIAEKKRNLLAEKNEIEKRVTSFINQRNRSISFQDKSFSGVKSELFANSTGKRKMQRTVSESSLQSLTSAINAMNIHSGERVKQLSLHKFLASLDKEFVNDKELEVNKAGPEKTLSEILPPILLPRIYEQGSVKRKKIRKYNSWGGRECAERKNSVVSNDITYEDLKSCRYLRPSVFRKK